MRPQFCFFAGGNYNNGLSAGFGAANTNNRSNNYNDNVGARKLIKYIIKYKILAHYFPQHLLKIKSIWIGLVIYMKHQQTYKQLLMNKPEEKRKNEKI